MAESVWDERYKRAKGKVDRQTLEYINFKRNLNNHLLSLRSGMGNDPAVRDEYNRLVNFYSYEDIDNDWFQAMSPFMSGWYRNYVKKQYLGK